MIPARIVLAVALATGSAIAASPLEIDVPDVTRRGASATITVRAAEPLAAPAAVEVRDADGRVEARGSLPPAGDLTLTIDGVGARPYFVFSPELRPGGERIAIRTIPGWISLVPPLLAIAAALVTRQVVPSLLLGIWSGAWIVGGGPLAGARLTVDRFAVSALADADHAAIVMFSLMLGGMVGIISRCGGMIGLVRALEPFATGRRSGQLVAWLLGLLVFFDDYANTLLVGNTMRPVCDRLRISRQKLAYVVDSTAAPVASIALVSTWIGYEVSLIHEALVHSGSAETGYGLFLRALPYNFYPLLALAFGAFVAGSGRDFGPMRKAEAEVASGALAAGDGAPEARDILPESHVPPRPLAAVVPVLCVLFVTFAGLWTTGRASLLADGDPAGTAALSSLGITGVGSVIGAGNSFQALLWASLAGSIVALGIAVAPRRVTLGQGMDAWVGGMKAMTGAIVVLILAWSLGGVCEALGTSGYMAAGVSATIDPRLLPTLIFVMAAATAFATGTSWATMSILIAPAVATALAYDGSGAGLLPASVSAVLAGAIFGDHCSPISDTTVMSSMASGCEHIEHVRTQLPYALTVGGVAVVCGYLPVGFGWSPWPGLLVGAATLALLLRLVGRSADA